MGGNQSKKVEVTHATESKYPNGRSESVTTSYSGPPHGAPTIQHVHIHCNCNGKNSEKTCGSSSCVVLKKY